MITVKNERTNIYVIYTFIMRKAPLHILKKLNSHDRIFQGNG